MAKTQAQLEVERHLADLKAVSSTHEGRRFMRWLLDITGYYRSTHSDDSDRKTTFLNGRRSIGVELQMNLDNADPLIMLRLIQETQEFKRDDRNKQRARSDAGDE